MMRNKIMSVMVLVMFAGLAGASITLEKTASTKEVSEGDVVQIMIRVVNGEDTALKSSVIDPVPYFSTVSGATMMGGWTPGVSIPVSIQPHSEETVRYTLTILSFPESWNNKQRSIGKAVIRDSKNKLIAESGSVSLTYVSEKNIICNYNMECEPGLGENHGNCQQDCFSGMDDGYCDQKKDYICDPDCGRSQDPDCGGTGKIQPVFNASNPFRGITTTTQKKTTTTLKPQVVTIKPEKKSYDEDEPLDITNPRSVLNAIMRNIILVVVSAFLIVAFLYVTLRLSK
ncbi:MAG: hypothetical protein ABIH11_06905 [Candidatus Altiarchaeota archaeon]